MKSNYFKFNVICLATAACFALGNGYLYFKGINNAENLKAVLVSVEAKALQLKEQQMLLQRVRQANNTSSPDHLITTSPENKATTTSSVQNNLVSVVVSTTGQITNLTNNEIPNKINLVVPFTSQAPEKFWGEPWQDACEEASVLMLDAYYKGYNLDPLFARDEIIKMVDWEENKGWGRSIEIAKVKQLAEENFNLKNIKIIENPTIIQIKTLLADGKPVLTVADGKVLPNPHFQNGGPDYHSLIIRGYNETEFITNDPGTQFGENFKYKYDDLMNAIHDWNGGKVSEGRRVVLVIE